MMRRWVSVGSRPWLHRFRASRGQLVPVGHVLCRKASQKPKSFSTSSAAAASDDSDEPLVRWGIVSMYVSGIVFGIVFAWHFRKAKYDLHQTDLLLLETWKRLPLCPALEPSEAELLSRIDAGMSNTEVTKLFSEWFVSMDAYSGGITREGILQLVEELGFNKEDKACQAFLMYGEGRTMEQRRRSGAGLQESVGLLELLGVQGDEAVNLLRAKLGSGKFLPGDGKFLFDGGSSMFNAVTSAAGSTQSILPGRAPPLLPELTTDDDIDAREYIGLERARLARAQDALLKQRERRGSLLPGEESRLRDLQEQLAALSTAH